MFGKGLLNGLRVTLGHLFEKILLSSIQKNIQSFHYVLVVLLNWIQKNVFHVAFVL